MTSPETIPVAPSQPPGESPPASVGTGATGLALSEESSGAGGALRDQRTVVGAPKPLSEKNREIVARLRNYIEEQSEVTKPTLREAQLEVLRDILAHLEAGHIRGYIKCPTGFGKTVMFAEIIEALRVATTVLVPKEIIANQAVDKIRMFTEGLQITRNYGDFKENVCAGQANACDVTTYQYVQKAAFDGRYDIEKQHVFVLDEGHKAIGPGFRRVIDEKIPEDAIVLAFTATPEYDEEHSVERHIGPCFSEMTVPEGIKGGALAPMVTMVARSKIDLSNVPLNTNGEYEEEQLGKTLEEKGAPQAAIQLYKKAFNDQSGICFCGTVAFAKKTAERFNAAGITAAAVDGTTPDKERDRIIKEYKAGKIKILCCADLLIEGFDEPRAQVCFNLAPTRSKVTAEQRGGRVGRLDPDNPSKFGTVIDFLYGDERDRDPQIFYFEILGECVCLAAKDRSGVLKDNIERLTRTLKEIDIPDLSLVVETEEILKIQRDRDPPKMLNDPPPNWILRDEVAKRTGLSRAMANKILDDFSDDFSDLRGIFRNPANNRNATYYSPDVVGRILEARAKDPRAMGWYSTTALGGLYLANTQELEGALENFQDSEGDQELWLSQSHANAFGSRRVAYYHPSVLDFLDERLERKPPSSWGMESVGAVSKDTKVPVEVIKRLYRDLHEEFPDISAPFIEGRILRAERELFSLLRERAYAWLGRLPSGKISVAMLALELEVTPDQIRALVPTKLVPPNVKTNPHIPPKRFLSFAEGHCISLQDILALYPNGFGEGMVEPVMKRILDGTLQKDLQKIRDEESAVQERFAARNNGSDEAFELEQLEELNIRAALGLSISPPQSWYRSYKSSSRSGTTVIVDSDNITITGNQREALPLWMFGQFKDPVTGAQVERAHPVLKKILLAKNPEK